VETKYKILIIDDEEIVLDSCTEILAFSYYQIETAGNGMQGLELMKELRPDLVIVDLKMPGISGLEVLENILIFDPTIVTIVITGYATVSSAVEAMKKGAYDYLPKPFTPDELRLIVKRGVEKRKLVLETISLRREKDMLRENFASIVSHELKSPLNAVQQNLFALTAELSGKLSEDQKNKFERMKSRIDELLNLIRTWLRMISVDIEKIKENFRPISIDLAIAKAIESVESHATRKDIKILAPPQEPARLVRGDEGTLAEVFVNIIGNAIKFSRVGSKITVKVEEKEDNILIYISDTGVGISKEDLPFIFGDFYTGKSEHTTERGSGLGLAISRRIIGMHNGSISVESELGKGSIFIVTLPLLKNNSHNQSTPDIKKTI
jgi:two-component system, sensor histidine kinase and response regulator